MITDVGSRYLELTRESYKRHGSDSSTLEVSMAEARELLRTELLAQPGGLALWDRWAGGRPRQRDGRSIRRQRARGEEVLASAEAVIAETAAWKAANPPAAEVAALLSEKRAWAEAST